MFPTEWSDILRELVIVVLGAIAGYFGGKRTRRR